MIDALADGDDRFEVTRLEPATARVVVVFAVGGGGDPARHHGLLAALADRGAVVAAPHSPRLVSPYPTPEHLIARARRLRLALDAVGRPGLPVVGIGHSIGATMLLALAGGQVWMSPAGPLPIPGDDRLARLALLAPAVGFFQVPGALAAVRARLLLWGASEDLLTPAAQIAAIARELPAAAAGAEVRVAAGAGHFSFMDVPPPGTVEPLADRDAFLAELRRELGDFVTA